jgi:predicted SprT family Zn-dependent metalloprotease
LGRSYHEHYPEDIVDTLKHEMIHIRLSNHSREFKEEAKRIGASMYARNYPGMLRGMKYMYVCPACNLSYPSRKMLRNRSCGPCSKGKYDSRFKLRFVKRLTDR